LNRFIFLKTECHHWNEYWNTSLSGKLSNKPINFSITTQRVVSLHGRQKMKIGSSSKETGCSTQLSLQQTLQKKSDYNVQPKPMHLHTTAENYDEPL
jgi:hypothetical protein